MIGQRLGPYAIDAELGSGGMGTVYRATGPEGTVALKVVHPHLLATPGFFKRFLREAEIGRAVRHANVVRTLDVDALDVDGRAVHYLVMEYVEGKSLRALLNDLGTVPETLLREIALQTAAGLAAIHEAGIVHRDLKPENVLITGDHEIRIMDLGVAKLQEASIAITRRGEFAGSVHYAAPEQFGGGDVGPSADLYSFGVLLHELATGDNPFRRDDVAAVLEAHLRLVPPRITDLAPEATPFLAEVVACLLAKNPAERFGSAQSLHDVLAGAERSAWWTERAPRLHEKTAHLPKIPVRRETKLHGRDSDLAALRAAWERACGGEGNTVFVEGEAGIGKTRFVDAFLRALGDTEVHVLYGSYPPSGGLGGISDAILGKFGEIELARALAPYLTVTPSLVPAFAALVKHEAPPSGAEPLQGDAMHAVCAHLMRALAAEMPVLWIVEDLQFTTKESRDTVLSLARAVEGHRILLVATARPGVPDEELAHFGRLENFERIKLTRLGGREIIELLEDAFKSEALAEKLGGKITRKSDGVPFFIFELIRELKGRRLIRQEPDGSYVQTQVVDEIEVPSAVKDLIEGRLGGLSRDERRILDAGSVLGMTFDPGLVSGALDEKRVRVLEHLAAIERRSGLVHGERGAIRFDQNQIQEILYLDLLPDLRSEYHTLLAEVYAGRIEGDPSGADAVFLASHHLRGSRPEDALPHLTPALDHLERSYRRDAVIELAGRALDTPGLLDGEPRAEVLLTLATGLALRGENEQVRARLDEALGLADVTGDAALHARVRVQLGRNLFQTADFAGAQQCLERSIELAREAGDSEVEAAARRALGAALVRQGRYEAGRSQFESCLELAREMGDEDSEAAATINLGIVDLNLGRHEQAAVSYEKGLALARSCGNRMWEANAAGNLGGVHSVRGRFDEARALYGQSLALAREIGDRHGEARCMGNEGNALQSQGRYEEARAQYERALAVSREIGDRESEARFTAGLGRISFSQGRHEQAGKQFERHLVLARATGDRRQEGFALTHLADLARARGDAAAALRLYRESMDLRRSLGEIDTVAETLVGLAGVELDQGEVESAASHLDEARSLAEELRAPELILSATVERARVPGGDAGAALAAFEDHGDRVGHDTRMATRFRLWELTHDRTHLEAAKRILDFAVEHCAEEHRTSMLENVPLHREIVGAWQEHR